VSPPMNSNQKTALRDLLVFYREAGVDASLAETALDRLTQEAEPAQVEPAHPVPSTPSLPSAKSGKQSIDAARSFSSALPMPPARPGEPVAHTGTRAGTVLGTAAASSPEAGLLAGRAAANSAGTLDELRALLDAFQGCSLRQTATQLVFADGNPEARVMFVGEAPGRDEDIAGLPFVGRSGKLLDRMMAAIGLDRTSAYIANVVPWRPPGNRTPTPQESAACLPFTRRQIELADPDILVCLGAPSAQTLLNTREGILKVRGRWFPFQTGTREIRATATLHPAYLLRQPIQKRFAWQDFLSIKQALSQAART
jgi:uracil-DNA glycosylase family 4